MRPREILLVADRPATARQVRDAILSRGTQGTNRVTLLVPSVPSKSGWTWDETIARGQARRRMTSALVDLRRHGIDVTGILGDFRPMDALRDEIRRHRYDEIVVSTPPARLSRWLRRDLPVRAAREFGIPVTQVVDDAMSHAPGLDRAEPAA